MDQKIKELKEDLKFLEKKYRLAETYSSQQISLEDFREIRRLKKLIKKLKEKK